MMNNWQKGQEGEELALNKYLEDGYVLVDRNFQYYSNGIKGRLGEIDLVVKKDNLLVFVEVKARSDSRYGHPVEQVSRKKLMSLYRAWQYYLLKNPVYRSMQMRFDVVSILAGEVTIYKNAYSFDGFF